eukprot:15346653-Ditylum_brightwellii.AAC.1
MLLVAALVTVTSAEEEADTFALPKRTANTSVKSFVTTKIPTTKPADFQSPSSTDSRTWRYATEKKKGNSRTDESISTPIVSGFFQMLLFQEKEASDPPRAFVRSLKLNDEWWLCFALTA